MWWNDAWATITAEQTLADCVNDGALAAFAEWLDTAGSGSSFELCIEADGYPQSPLQLAQTPLSNATVVTSITTSMPPPVPSPNIPTAPLPTRKARHILEDFSEFGPNFTHRSSKNPTPTPSRNRSPSLRTPKPPKHQAAAAQQTSNEHPNGEDTESSSTPTTPMVARTGIPAAEPPDTEPAQNGKPAKSRTDAKRQQQGAAEKKPEIPRPKNHAPEDNFTRQELDIAMTGVAAEYDRLVATTEWEKTRLGPYSEWSSALKSMMGICFASATQDSIWFRPLDSDETDDIHIV